MSEIQRELGDVFCEFEKTFNMPFSDYQRTWLIDKSLRVESLSTLQKRVEERGKALEICVMFLTNVNTIETDKCVELVRHLKDADMVELADSVSLVGFASLLGGA